MNVYLFLINLVKIGTYTEYTFSKYRFILFFLFGSARIHTHTYPHSHIHPVMHLQPRTRDCVLVCHTSRPPCPQILNTPLYIICVSELGQEENTCNGKSWDIKSNQSLLTLVTAISRIENEITIGIGMHY